MTTLISGSATAEGTKRYLTRLASTVVPAHFRELEGIAVATIGLGTYLGREDGATDVMYQDAIALALELGVNTIDTAINYRHQRSERSVRAALASAISGGAVRRDEVVVATKGGYIPFDGAVPRDARAWFTQTYLDTGIVRPGDVVAGTHCMTPRYLALAELVGAARAVAGSDHHFKVIQLPYNLAMPEAFTRANQQVDGSFVPLLEAARRLGVYVVASASVYQGHLTRNLPPVVAEL